MIFVNCKKCKHYWAFYEHPDNAYCIKDNKILNKRKLPIFCKKFKRK